MFGDASAIIAILTGETDGERLASAIDQTPSVRPITSIIAIWEATVGLYRKKRIPMSEAEARIAEFLQESDIETVPLGMEELALALQAFDRYGRHRYPEGERIGRSTLETASTMPPPRPMAHRSCITIRA